jgi:N-acyl-D-amino-acid deacylase
MQQRQLAAQGDVRFPIEWTTLTRVSAVISNSVESPATSLHSSGRRRSVSTSIGLEDRAATPAQLERMRELVRREMEDGRAGHRLVADLRTGLLCLD